MDRDSDSGRPGGLGAPLLVAGLLTLAAGGAFFWYTTSKPPLAPEAAHPLAFRPIEIDRERLERQRRRTYGSARAELEDADLGSFYNWVRKLNRAQFPPVDEQRQNELARKLTFEAEDAAKITGFDAFVAAGEPIFEKCSRGLEALLEAVRGGSLSMESAQTDPSAETYAAYRSNCGAFLETLRKRRLVTSSGEWATPDRSRTIADLLQRLRWGSMLREVRPPLMQLTDYGRRILMRWRIETEAYPVHKRRKYLAQLARQPGIVEDYDVTLARAKLAYATAGPRRAADILRKALEKKGDEHDDYRRRLQWLQQKLPATAPSDDPAHDSPAPSGGADEPT